MCPVDVEYWEFMLRVKLYKSRAVQNPLGSKYDILIHQPYSIFFSNTKKIAVHQSSMFYVS